ncbi:MAG: HAD family hydrolase [Gemmatimonadetes bacterium]|nr:HAD family hydrolase [Gemmatimonadota bacterium]
MTDPTPPWIFFDCFNTLLDDFDETGDESGLSSILDLPVREGYFAAARDFVNAYSRWRQNRLTGDDSREVLLSDRLADVLATSGMTGRMPVHRLVREMIEEFERSYPKQVRPTPGVEAMLAAWRGRVRMGVVSNFYLPGWPEQLLADHGLLQHFEFVIDSADIGFRKPGAEIYREALRQAGLTDDRAGDVLFIGDNLRNDVLGPRSLGMSAIYFDRSLDRPMTEPQTWKDSITHWDAFRPR